MGGFPTIDGKGRTEADALVPGRGGAMAGYIAELAVGTAGGPKSNGISKTGPVGGAGDLPAIADVQAPSSISAADVYTGTEGVQEALELIRRGGAEGDVAERFSVPQVAWDDVAEPFRAPSTYVAAGFSLPHGGLKHALSLSKGPPLQYSILKFLTRVALLTVFPLMGALPSEPSGSTGPSPEEDGIKTPYVFRRGDIFLKKLDPTAAVGITAMHQLEPSIVSKGGRVVDKTQNGNCLCWLGRRLGLDLDGTDISLSAFLDYIFRSGRPVSEAEAQTGDIVLYLKEQTELVKDIRYGTLAASFFDRTPDDTYFNIGGQYYGVKHVGIVSEVKDGKVLVTSKWRDNPVFEAPFDVNSDQWGDHAVIIRPGD